MAADPLAGVTPPLDGRAFRWSVGTRPMPMADWLIVDDHRHCDLAAKDRLFAAVHDEVVVATEAGANASSELLATVGDHLATHFGDVYDVGDSFIRDRLSGRITPTDSLDPIDAVGRVVAEDFCVLTRHGGEWILTAASVCFTSRWRLRDKIGSNVTAIHGPVPGYEERLGNAVDKLFDRITPEAPLARSNWTLLDTPELHLPVAASERADAGGQTPDELGWVRVERQTLRRLRQTGAVIFTILTRVTPAADLPSQRRLQLSRLLPTVPADIAAYKGW